MLVIGSRLTGQSVMSLQTGAPLGKLAKPIVDPSNLHIVAFELEGALLTEKPSFLRTSDIREYAQLGAIIDSSDELIGRGDVIKIDQLYELAYTLIGARVIDQTGRKLGKVDDYTVDTLNFSIQQLSVKQGFIRGINDTGRLVHRSQIVEINNTTIVVKAPTINEREAVSMPTEPLEFANPFRSQGPQVETEATQTNK